MSKAKSDEPAYEVSESEIHNVLRHWTMSCKELNYVDDNDPDRIPYIVFDREAYTGFEAHLFTVADMSLWFPELLPSGDIVIFNGLRHVSSSLPDALARERQNGWEILSRSFDFVMHQTQQYRKSVEQGYEPDEVWARHEREWQCALWEVPENKPQYIERILRSVDESIRDHILTMNVHGFVTIESCSGLKKDHDDRRPFNPFVFFDDEYYLDASAHIFTLANAAGWEPGFGAHGFDVHVECYADGDRAIEKAWKRLAQKAVTFGEMLEDYRELVATRNPNPFLDIRQRRGLFGQRCTEGRADMMGLVESLEEIENEYIMEEDE